MTQPGNVLLPPTITLSLSLLLLLLSSLRYSWGEDDEDAAYVTYEGRRINNHSYVDVSLMNNASSVQCHSHLHTCCSAQQGGDRGDWYSPSGEQLKFLTPSVKGEFQTRLPQRVELRCTTRNVCVSGLYRCGIMIHYPQIRRVRRIIYVGLYGDAEGVNKMRITNKKFVFFDDICRWGIINTIWRVICHGYWECSVHPHLYLHWRTCYHCHLDQRLHPSQLRSYTTCRPVSSQIHTHTGGL